MNAAERTVIAVDTGEDALRIVSRHPDATTARKALSDLEVGTYHILTFVEAGIEIEPPPETTRKKVTRGQTFITKTRTEGASAAGSQEAQEAAPTSGRRGLFS